MWSRNSSGTEVGASGNCESHIHASPSEWWKLDFFSPGAGWSLKAWNRPLLRRQADEWNGNKMAAKPNISYIAQPCPAIPTHPLALTNHDHRSNKHKENVSTKTALACTHPAGTSNLHSKHHLNRIVLWAPPIVLRWKLQKTQLDVTLTAYVLDDNKNRNSYLFLLLLLVLLLLLLLLVFSFLSFRPPCFSFSSSSSSSSSSSFASSSSSSSSSSFCSSSTSYSSSSSPAPSFFFFFFFFWLPTLGLIIGLNLHAHTGFRAHVDFRGGPPPPSYRSLLKPPFRVSVPGSGPKRKKGWIPLNSGSWRYLSWSSVNQLQDFSLKRRTVAQRAAKRQIPGEKHLSSPNPEQSKAAGGSSHCQPARLPIMPSWICTFPGTCSPFDSLNTFVQKQHKRLEHNVSDLTQFLWPPQKW